MPSEWIHHPWDAPPSVLRSAGVELGLNYPVPIVDIDLARERLTARCQLSSLIFVACLCCGCQLHCYPGESQRSSSRKSSSTNQAWIVRRHLKEGFVRIPANNLKCWL